MAQNPIQYVKLLLLSKASGLAIETARKACRPENSYRCEEKVYPLWSVFMTARKLFGII